MYPRAQPLDAIWVCFALAMLAVMLFTDVDMTVPYQVIVVSFALVYGFRLWSGRTSILIIVVMTLLTGVVFLKKYLEGVVGLEELAEVPLMPAILGFMVWHGLRRVSAQREVDELAALERSRVQRQREFLRDTSHAIRTPVTVAMGHVELLRLGSQDPVIIADADEVVHQLQRLGELARRLLTMESLDTARGLHREWVDVTELLGGIGARWRTAVPRRWVIDTADVAGAIVPLNRSRLEESLDALLENAVRFTTDADVVRLSAARDADGLVIEVADSGPGIPDGERDRVFDRFFHRTPPDGPPGTGLGLALVRSVARAHGGIAIVATAPEGGALLRLRLPVRIAGPAAAGPAMRTELVDQQIRTADSGSPSLP